jgi:outer membrane protein assembly factor BamB
MNPSDILLLGLKKSVTAFHRADGSLLWKTELPNGSGGAFVTVLSDARRVYATCNGALTCLDLFTGAVLWSDPLKGYGYGIGGLCLPDAPPTLQAAAAAQVAEEAQRQSADAAT